MQLKLSDQNTDEDYQPRFTIMDFYFARVIAFFLLFTTAISAPTGPHDACADVSQSALEFNKIAKVAANTGSKGIKNFSTSLAWMEAQDMCDPGTLRHTPAPCIEKIVDVLTSYKSFVETVGEFESCAVAHEVKPVLKKLHTDVSRCVRSRTGYHHQKANHISVTQSLDSWEKELLCQYTMERLFSFSILTARVFSVGDPANHTEPTALKCPENN